MHAGVSSPFRNPYQEKRLHFLQQNIDIQNMNGLEIGACHLPTVPAHLGGCKFADFRTAEEMSQMWGIDRNSVCEVDFVVNRGQDLSVQISEKFDYVIACHVLEHVPDPINYIIQLSSLLRSSGKIFLSVPDKRTTAEKERPSVTIDHLLMEFHDKCRYPSIEHIMEFHRYCIEADNGYKVPIDEAYYYASGYHSQGNADVHCHAWSDGLFYDQFLKICEFPFFNHLSLSAFENTPDGFNEFSVVFTKN